MLACTITARLAYGRAVRTARVRRKTRPAVLLQDRLDAIAATTHAVLDGTAVLDGHLPPAYALDGIDLHAREAAHRATRTALLTRGVFWE